MKRRDLTKTCAYFESVVCAGLVILENGEELLIDTGIDDSVANKILRQLNDGPQHVLSTHHHADHVGGNAKVRKKTDARFYAAAVEKSLIESPLYEPYYLYGAHPFESIDSKFVHAAPSTIDQVVAPGPWPLGGTDLELVDLKGHAPGMVGLLTPEGILYAADAVMGDEPLDRHQLIFLYDVDATLETLDRLDRLMLTGMVMAHGGYTDDPGPLIERNRRRIIATRERIAGFFTSDDALSFDAIRQLSSDAFGTKEGNVGSFLLNSSVIKAHLSSLIGMGAISCEVGAGLLQYRRR